jgi:Arc/MetJ-type ribon-helix-helix transcriptional regulator
MSVDPIGRHDELRLEPDLPGAERIVRELAGSLGSDKLAAVAALLHDYGENSPEFGERLRRLASLTAARRDSDLKPLGRARKVSVSMPEDLAAAVQRRVGRGEFSHYVTAAVTRQLELDLLDELSTLLETEHGPVPEELLAEAEAAWPDAE